MNLIYIHIFFKLDNSDMSMLLVIVLLRNDRLHQQFKIKIIDYLKSFYRIHINNLS